MKRLSTLLFLMLISNIHAQDVQFDWAGALINASSLSVDIEFDGNGNVYNVGIFNETQDFDFGTSNYTLTNGGSMEQYIQKMTPDGNLIWAYALDGRPKSIAVDSLGNLFILGEFNSESDFDPGVGTVNVMPQGGDDAFLLKIDPNGNFLWVKIIGGPAYVFPSKMALKNESIYFVGTYEGTVDFDPSANVYERTSTFSTDLFIQKMDLDGNHVWTKFVEGNSMITAEGIAIDNSGNVCFQGRFYDDFDFDPSASTYMMSSTIGTGTPFIEKLTSNGDFLWVQPFNTSISISGADFGAVKVDAADNLYLFGSYSSFYTVNNGTTFYSTARKGIVQKLNANGDLLWEREISGDSHVYIEDGDLDEYGNIYFTGFYNNTCDFDPSSATFLLSSNGDKDIFIEKIASTGDFMWAMSFGGTAGDEGRSIKLSADGAIYTKGDFRSINIDLDPTDGQFLVSAPGGCSNVYVQKFNQPTLSLLENNLENELYIFPNPSNGKVTIDVQTAGKGFLCVSDVQGRLCYENANLASGTAQINLNLTPGVYSIQLSNVRGSLVKKLVVQ